MEEEAMKVQQNIKTALITGAARRIGAAIAKKLHAAGMNIVLHYHTSEQAAEALCAELNAIRPHSAVMLAADLLVTAHLAPLVTKAHAVWGRLDVLVNNASQFYPSPLGEVTELAFEELLGSNVKAPFFLVQAATPYLTEQQGCVINIADIYADRPLRHYSVYCIAKAGLIMLTKALAKELAPHIRVNAISPSAILWPEGDNVLSTEKKQQIIERIPLGRVGEPDDIANAALFLAEEATFMTGHELVVDGGRLLG